MFMLVNKVKETMETMVAKNLFTDATIVDMLAEDPKITKKREETQQAIVYLEEAIEKINFMQASGDLKEDE
jgi:singapore isolate B (sub-type 7) whole genome shotgun sequence assembly, scaffold_2